MKNKKIGILTFHQALSYGAKLQAYALQQFMQRNGIENEIIDYTCRFMYTHLIRTIRFGKKNKMRAIYRSLITMRQTGIDRRKSVKFRNEYMKLSRPFTDKNIAEAADEYAAFIAGSDQVWSPTVVGFDKVYFLDFARPEQKYSYAASIGEKSITDDKIEEYKRLFSDFQRFSVREQNAANIVKKLTNRDALINIDPTLLLTSAQWDEIIQPVPNFSCGEPYIFVFNVKTPKSLFKYALELGRKTGMRVISIQKNKRVRVKGIEYLDPVMANEFVWLIKNAKYVVTNSFHGTAFSIIYHKDFAIELDYQGGRNMRSENLIKNLGIDKTEILADNFPLPDETVDWDFTDRRIEEYRKEALSYLMNIKKEIYGE